MENAKTTKKKWIGILIAVVVAAAVVAGYFQISNAAKPKEEEALLRDYPVSRGNITAGTDGSGGLQVEGQPHNFSMPVTLEEVYVNPGDNVAQGDQLAKISEAALQKKIQELELELKKAKLAVADAKNNKSKGALGLEKLQDPDEVGKAQYQSEKNAAKTQADAAQAKINEMQAQIAAIDEKLATLAPEDPEIEVLNQQKAALEQELGKANEELGAANASINQIDAVRQDQINQQEKTNNVERRSVGYDMKGYDNAISLAALEVEKVEKQIAELQTIQENPVLYAQRGGVVLEVGYTPGQETTLDKPVAKIGSLEDIFALLQVTQNDIASIEAGQDVEYQLDAFPGKQFKGKVLEKMLIPVKDSNPVAYTVKASIEADGEQLLSGMTCSAQFIVKQVKDVLQISNKAIKLKDGKQVVLLKDEQGQLYEQEITTGFSDGKFSEVLSGLKEGDTVYVEG